MGRNSQLCLLIPFIQFLWCSAWTFPLGRMTQNIRISLPPSTFPPFSLFSLFPASVHSSCTHHSLRLCYLRSWRRGPCQSFHCCYPRAPSPDTLSSSLCPPPPPLLSPEFQTFSAVLSAFQLDPAIQTYSKCAQMVQRNDRACFKLSLLYTVRCDTIAVHNALAVRSKDSATPSRRYTVEGSAIF